MKTQLIKSITSFKFLRRKRKLNIITAIIIKKRILIIIIEVYKKKIYIYKFNHK